MPANPPRNGATQVKLTIVNASAPKIVPTIAALRLLRLEPLQQKFGSVDVVHAEQAQGEDHEQQRRGSMFMTGSTLSSPEHRAARTPTGRARR